VRHAPRRFERARVASELHQFGDAQLDFVTGIAASCEGLFNPSVATHRTSSPVDEGAIWWPMYGPRRWVPEDNPLPIMMSLSRISLRADSRARAQAIPTSLSRMSGASRALTGLRRSLGRPALLAAVACACACSAAGDESSDAPSTAPISTAPVAVPTQEQPASADPPPLVATGVMNHTPDPENLVVDRPEDEKEAERINPEPPMPEMEVSTMVNEECAATEVMAVDLTTIQPADIIFAIDTSSSMGEETEFVQTYMNEFSQQIIDSGVDAHVILLANAGEEPPPPAEEPAPGEEPADGDPAPMQQPGGFQLGGRTYSVCIGAPLGSGNCPADENLPIYAHVNAPVGSNNVLNVILDTMPQWKQHLRPEASKFFVVVSDDDATDAPNNSAQAFSDALMAAEPELFAQWSFNGIFCGMECSYSIAIGQVFQDLVAQTDGVAGELCSQDFQPVFDRLAEQIIADAGSEIACEWELPPPPQGQTFSVDLVQVDRTTDAAGTVPFKRVNSLADCGAQSWYFDNPLNPTKVLACPDTCAAMQEEDGGRIDVSFSCELIAGCAASSASTEAQEVASCAFPLPMPPEGVLLTVSTVNVRYETPSGFGVVLGKVDNADGCANVGGGWYFDNPEEPTSISLCPTTCTDYEAGVATNVQALFGCESKPAEPLTVR